MRLIRDAGGVPVIAHPATRGREPNVSEKGFAALVDAGLMGVEIDHRENTPPVPRASASWPRSTT